MSRRLLVLTWLVVAPLAAQPTLSKSFNPPSIVAGSQTGLLTFVITNTPGDLGKR